MKEKKKSPIWLKIIKVIVAIPVIGILGFCLLVLVLRIAEYRPDPIEEIVVEGAGQETLKAGDELTVVSWNIGYSALGETEDYFLDGGNTVNAPSKEYVTSNLEGIKSSISEMSPDILLLQETDRDSKRSFYVDEKAEIAGMDSFANYDSTYATNYRVMYVPYPFPTIGKVEGGISTFSKYDIAVAQRYSLPCPFEFPWRLCNLKRCVAVNRIPVEGSDKELVVINLHLEAYDSGEGKVAQTAQLKELLQKEVAAGNYVIAGGDFNQTFSNADTSAYPQVTKDMWTPGIIDVQEFGSDFQFIMDTDTASCRSLDKPYADADKENFQYYVIDGFIVSNNVEISESTTIDYDYKNSDHNPLMLKIKLKD